MGLISEVCQQRAYQYLTCLLACFAGKIAQLTIKKHFKSYQKLRKVDTGKHIHIRLFTRGTGSARQQAQKMQYHYTIPTKRARKG